MQTTVFLVAVLLSFAAPGAAATLTGRVQDTSGGAIPEASIVVACPSFVQQATSDVRGRFVVTRLPPARCSVSAGHPQFASTLVHVDLTSGADATVSLVLPVETLVQSVVVTPARGGREAAAEVPSTTSVVTARDLAMRPYQVLPQALREEPGVTVQQTTAAAGSPIIRGFTGQSNVYLVDGVRLNTSAWRSGPSQYFAWLSPSMAERLEVVRGPMSVQYGSDALGGAINLLTAMPAFSSAGLRVDGTFESMLGSSDASGGGDALVRLHAPRAAIALGGGGKRVGDLRAGGGRDSHAAVTRFLGLPSSALSRRLEGTGYEQWNAQAAGQLRVGSRGVLSGSYRRDRQSGVDRYDRVAGGEGFFRSELTPQQLDFAVLRYEHGAAGWFDAVRATFSVNRQQDGSIEQPRNTSRVDAGRTAVTALGYQAQGTRRMGAHAVMAGAELYDERIDAVRWQDTAGVRVALRPLIPDGTTYRSTGLFTQFTSGELWRRVSLRGGVRYNRYVYETRADEAFGVHAEQVATNAATFNASAILKLSASLRATASVSRGFRAANMSDLGAIGVSGGGGFEIAPAVAGELGAFVGTTDNNTAVSTGRPAGDLAPESVYAYEAGLRYAASRGEAGVTVFDLELFDAIQRRSLIFDRPVVGVVISGQEIVRQDTGGRAYIAIDPRPVATRANASRGRIRGFEAIGTLALSRAWSVRGHFAMANGRDLHSGAFMRRMPPAMGGATVAWQPDPRGMRAEASVTFARPQTRLSSGDLGDARIGGRRTAASIASFFNGRAVDLGLVRDGILQPTGETLADVQARLLGGATQSYLFTEAPGWVALGARVLVPMGRRLDLIVIGENLTDRNYRLMGSGVDAPGINAQVRIRVVF